MKQYLTLLREVMENGFSRPDRTGTGIISSFGHQVKYDISEKFPLITTKKVHLKSVIYELLWFLKGDTNIKFLKDHNIKIWDPWADKNGDVGKIYGYQWRSWEASSGHTIDQIQKVIHDIKEDPCSRRHIVNAWNVGNLNEMALPPCHTLFQFYVAEGKLSCQLYQRSADLFLGVPFNIASYSLLTMMIAQACNLKPGVFVHTIGDAHIYKNHIEQCRLQLSRTPKELPTMAINKEIKNIFDFKYEDFRIENYFPYPTIKAPISV